MSKIKTQTVEPCAAHFISLCFPSLLSSHLFPLLVLFLLPPSPSSCCSNKPKVTGSSVAVTVCEVKFSKAGSRLLICCFPLNKRFCLPSIQGLHSAQTIPSLVLQGGLAGVYSFPLSSPRDLNLDRDVAELDGDAA